jgi:hypothetical protein
MGQLVEQYHFTRSLPSHGLLSPASSTIMECDPVGAVRFEISLLVGVEGNCNMRSGSPYPFAPFGSPSVTFTQSVNMLVDALSAATGVWDCTIIPQPPCMNDGREMTNDK